MCQLHRLSLTVGNITYKGSVLSETNGKFEGFVYLYDNPLRPFYTWGVQGEKTTTLYITPSYESKEVEIFQMLEDKNQCYTKHYTGNTTLSKEEGIVFRCQAKVALTNMDAIQEGMQDETMKEGLLTQKRELRARLEFYFRMSSKSVSYSRIAANHRLEKQRMYTQNTAIKKRTSSFTNLFQRFTNTVRATQN